MVTTVHSLIHINTISKVPVSPWKHHKTVYRRCPLVHENTTQTVYRTWHYSDRPVSLRLQSAQRFGTDWSVTIMSWGPQWCLLFLIYSLIQLFSDSIHIWQIINIATVNKQRYMYRYKVKRGKWIHINVHHIYIHVDNITLCSLFYTDMFTPINILVYVKQPLDRTF